MQTPQQNAIQPGSIFMSVLAQQERSGWLCPNIANFLITLMLSGRAGGFNITTKRPIDWARNCAVTEFLTSRCEWLLFVDNDQSPEPGLYTILDRVQPSMDIVVPKFYTGRSPQEQTKTVLCWQVLNSDDDPQSEWRELLMAGTGTMFIHRRVLLAMGNSDWFRFVVGANGRWLEGEDQYFCRRARALGFRIWGNMNYSSDHYHTRSLNEIAETQGWEFISMTNCGTGVRLAPVAASSPAADPSVDSKGL